MIEIQSIERLIFVRPPDRPPVPPPVRPFVRPSARPFVRTFARPPVRSSARAPVVRPLVRWASLGLLLPCSCWTGT